MPSGFNLSTSGMLASQRIDPGMQRLAQMARIPQSFNPTATRIQAMNEQDKQNEENATFIFEYRALLSSRLQQLITKLTNAFTSVLDGALGASGSVPGLPSISDVGGDVWRNTGYAAVNMPWGQKNAMQGNGPEDPGAARATFAYLRAWGNVTANASNAVAYGDANTPPSPQGASVQFTFDPVREFQTSEGIFRDLNDPLNVLQFDPSDQDAGSGWAGNLSMSQGTTTLQSGGSQNLLGAYKIRFKPPLLGNGLPGDNVIGLESTAFQETLAKAFRKREFHDILRWGMMGKDGDAIYIASTTTTSSGSQIQSTLKLEYIGDGGGGYITVKQDRWSAFYHS